MTALVVIVAIVTVAWVTVPRKTTFRTRSAAGKPNAKVRKAAFDVGSVMTEVATRLRSGVSVRIGWEKTLAACGFIGDDVLLDDDGVPRLFHRLARAGYLERRRAGLTKVSAQCLPAVIATCRLGHRSGAPLADVLDECAEGIIESSEAVSAREVAMAGPETSAYMLAYLPLVGLGFGYLIGAQPLGFFGSSVVGRIVLVAGLFLEFVGIVWTRRLIAQARKEEGAS